MLTDKLVVFQKKALIYIWLSSILTEKQFDGGQHYVSLSLAFRIGFMVSFLKQYNSFSFYWNDNFYNSQLTLTERLLSTINEYPMIVLPERYTVGTPNFWLKVEEYWLSA